MEKININDVEYEVKVNERDAIDKDVLKEKITDYYDNFDYIVGDWAYGKVRLKGFYDSKNKNCKKFNDIASVEDYIKNNCAYGCRWFELKKVNK